MYGHRNLKKPLLCLLLFGQISTLTASDQGFLLANDISDEICILRADGVAGMGRPKSGKAAFDLPTVFETFVNNGEIEGVFSFHHARWVNTSRYSLILAMHYNVATAFVLFVVMRKMSFAQVVSTTVLASLGALSQHSFILSREIQRKYTSYLKWLKFLPTQRIMWHAVYVI